MARSPPAMSKSKMLKCVSPTLTGTPVAASTKEKRSRVKVVWVSTMGAEFLGAI